MKTILTVFFVLICTLSWSQRAIIKRFNLEENPSLHQIDSAFVEESLVTVLDYRAINTRSFLGQSFFQINTTHKILKVQDDVGVKVANTLSIPMSSTSKLLKLQVRTISPNGEVKNFNIDNLVELESDQGYNIKKFAIEGVEIGGEIEYLYCVESNLKSYGRLYFSSPYPIQDLKVEFFTPMIDYVVKSYNGLPAPKVERKRISLASENILPLTKEGASSYRSKVKRIDYKVSYLKGQDVKMTWKSLTTSIMSNFSSNKGGSKVNKFLKPLNIKDLDLESKILAIENEIKRTIVHENNNFKPSVQQRINPYEDVPSILKNKISNSVGLFRLYAKCFDEMNIPYEFIMSCSRFTGEIDERFAHPMDFSKPLFYFHKIDKYIDPIDPTIRLGFPSPELGHSRALKMKEYSNGMYSESTFRFVKLPMLNIDQNLIATNTKVKLNDDNNNTLIEFEQEFTGYRAFNSRYAALKLKDGDEFHKFLINGIEDLKINNYEFENENVELSNKPETSFVVKGNLESESVVENLEDDILVHLGKLIGQQSKLYKEQNRVNDVVLAYPKKYNHRIEFEIPEGYSCQNVENLKKILSFENRKGEKHLFFELKYTLENNNLIIELEEIYDTIFIDKDNYDDYRSVVNAAADFNAFTLVLEKK